MDKPFPLLTAKDIREMAEVPHQHQFNSNAVRHTRSLGDHLGLTDLGVHLVRVEPGHDSTQFHFHHQDEEFLYILDGTGIAEIGEDRIRVNVGDFMAFNKHSLPHNLHNDASQDLLYLMGGTRADMDVCDYPRIKRRMYRENGIKTYVQLDQVHDV